MAGKRGRCAAPRCFEQRTRRVVTKRGRRVTAVFEMCDAHADGMRRIYETAVEITPITTQEAR